ncbi:MAG: YraN family protein [Proteobacteria bacterium]|nr:YraN family protein [Pseudomonadota bacterium]
MKKLTGQRAENLAQQYLERQGLVCIQRNFRCSSGEIDLIMRDGIMIIFAEVRYRKAFDYGESVETVVRAKQQRIIRAAWCYLIENHFVDKIHGRFDVIGVDVNEQINWIQNAFEVEY